MSILRQDVDCKCQACALRESFAREALNAMCGVDAPREEKPIRQ